MADPQGMPKVARTLEHCCIHTAFILHSYKQALTESGTDIACSCHMKACTVCGLYGHLLHLASPHTLLTNAEIPSGVTVLTSHSA